MHRFDYRGTTALITGASSGIGKVLAQRIAARGVSRFLLVGRHGETLRSVAESLGSAHVEVIEQDLAVHGGFRLVSQALGQTPVDVLINSAGFGSYGRLEHQDATTIQEEISLNCSALVGLSAAVLPGMQARHRGVIVNVASTAGLQPLPYMSVYGATKAFVVSFSEALWGENRSSGVRVLALCPGATETAFFDRVGTQEASVGTRQSPEAVVKVALRAIDRGRPLVISGFRNAVLSGSTRFAPRRAVIAGAAIALRPNAPEAR